MASCGCTENVSLVGAEAGGGGDGGGGGGGAGGATGASAVLQAAHKKTSVRLAHRDSLEVTSSNAATFTPGGHEKS